jgi:O-antigen/teichoic acid export membrane protein
MLSPIKFAKRVKEAMSHPESLGASLVKGVVGTAGVKVAQAAITFVSAAILAQILGPARYGIFTLVLAFVALLTIPSELGIPGLAVREIAVTNAHKDWEQMRGFIVWSHRLVAVTCSLLIAVGAACLLIWGDLFTPVKRSCMWLGLILVPVLSFGALRDAMLRGLRKVVLGQLPQQVIRPAIFLALLLAYLHVETGAHSPVVVMSLHIASVVLAFCFGLFFFLRARPPELSGSRSKYNGAVWLKSSIPFGLSAALQLINGRTDVLTLGFFRTDAEIGIYRVASQMAAVVVFALLSINIIQGPHIAHLFSKGDMQMLQKMINRSAQATMLFALPVVFVIVVFGQLIINTVFGHEYGSAYVPLVILCVGQLVNASMGSVGALLNMTGHERDTTRSILIAAIVNVALNLSLVPYWGIIGAAVATACTLIVWNVIMWHKVRTRIGIEPSLIFRRRS